MEKTCQVPRDVDQQQSFNNCDLCVLKKKNQVKMYTMSHKRSKSFKNRTRKCFSTFSKLQEKILKNFEARTLGTDAYCLGYNSYELHGLNFSMKDLLFFELLVFTQYSQTYLNTLILTCLHNKSSLSIGVTQLLEINRLVSNTGVRNQNAAFTSCSVLTLRPALSTETQCEPTVATSHTSQRETGEIHFDILFNLMNISKILSFQLRVNIQLLYSQTW